MTHASNRVIVAVPVGDPHIRPSACRIEYDGVNRIIGRQNCIGIRRGTGLREPIDRDVIIGDDRVTAPADIDDRRRDQAMRARTRYVELDSVAVCQRVDGSDEIGFPRRKISIIGSIDSDDFGLNGSRDEEQRDESRVFNRFFHGNPH